MEGSSIVEGRGRPRKTIGQNIKRFRVDLSLDLIHDRALWCCLIRVANPHLVFWKFCCNLYPYPCYLAINLVILGSTIAEPS